MTLPFNKKQCSGNTNITSSKCYNNFLSFSSHSRVFEGPNSIHNGLVNGVRYMAGHSKWQNIKHIKAAKDLQKSMMCSRISMLARKAIKEGGSDPKLNNKLADVFSLAQKNSVPFTAIEGAIKKAASGKIKPGFIEIAGPGGCLILLDYETDSVSDIRYAIKMAVKRNGCSIMQGEGRWRAAYEQKGILKIVGRTDGKSLDAESALDSAIEAGAEDVQLRNDEEHNENFLEFFCAPTDLHIVKKELESMFYKIEDSYVGYIPNMFVPLASEDMKAASNLLSDLENIPDIVRLYENIQ